MKASDLEQALNAAVESPRFSPAAMIESRGTRGFVYLLGENWGGDWRSGDVAVLWEDGERTVLPEEFEVIALNAWELPLRQPAKYGG